MKQEITKLKNSLKEFYQKQLDTVLKEKVEEFQKEIDKAQAIMHVELRKQEKLAEDKLHTEMNRLKEAYVRVYFLRSKSPIVVLLYDMDPI